MGKFIKSDITRLKGDGAAITAIILLGISFLAIALFSIFTTMYRLQENFFVYMVFMVAKWLLYSMPAASLMLYLEVFYKTKRHTNTFLLLGSIATAAQLGVIAFNWSDFTMGFGTDTMHLLFTVSLILLVVQPLVTLVSFLTELKAAFPRLACLLTVIALTLYFVMVLLAGYYTLALLTGAYIIYSIGLFIAIPKIVDFQREHGHYIHHT